MAGSDTFRGCSFQAAFCVGLALDVLGGEAEVLLVEGRDDAVDAALEQAGGPPSRLVQAKTKVEPYVWAPGEIGEILQRLSEQAGSETRIEFVTDGSLGPAVQNRLVPALRRIAEGTASGDDLASIAEVGLDATNEVLTRASIHSRVPEARTLLEQATLRVVELRERVAAVTVDEARDIVMRLFGEVVITSGDADVERRRLTREQIAEIVGVPSEVIDAAEPWSEEIETDYRGAIAEVPPDAAWTLLDLLPSEHPPVLTFVTASAAQDAGGVPSAVPATALLARSDDVFLQGPAGAGKTTTLAQLRAEGLEQGLLMIPLRIASYVAGSLEDLLRRTLERETKRPLAPGVVPQLLARDGTVVLLDGVGELLVEQRAAVIEDLQLLRGRYPPARFIVAGRDPAPFAPAALTGFAVQGLDDARQREIATSLVDGGDRFLPDIETRLGDAAKNPLLFAMAMGLYARGLQPASRAELIAGFVEGLERRPEGAALSDVARAAVECACFELRVSGRFSADRWWWLDSMAEARQQLIERGVVAEDAPSADDLLDELLKLGLAQTLPGSPEVALLHDLFADWLGSEAVRHGLRQLPSEIGESLEESVAFLAEAGALDDDALLLVAQNAIAAARAAESHPARDVDIALANEIWEGLRAQLGDQLRTRLDGLRLNVVAGDPPVVLLGDRGVVDDDEAVRKAVVACIATGNVSSLSVAVDAWRSVLQLELRPDFPEVPLSPAPDTEALAQKIEDAVRARADAVDDLVSRTVPGLAERVKREIGPSGLRGWLLPPEPHPIMPGSAETIEEHTLVSQPSADGVYVQCVSGADEIPDDEPCDQAIAESVVRVGPAHQAYQRVVAALGSIVPKWGP